MRIAIIGGGWVGCHLANKLRDVHTVTIFEKNAKLFQESSYNNQNRLHRGYHYARNSKTRELCADTFTRFTDDYNFLVEPVFNNAYAIPSESVLDYGTYKKIFYDYHFSEVSYDLDNLKEIPGVDILSVDVEGFDLQVLRSNDWNKYKPNIIIAECLNARFSDVNSDPVTKYLLGLNYSIYAKTGYSLIFQKLEDAYECR